MEPLNVSMSRPISNYKQRLEARDALHGANLQLKYLRRFQFGDATLLPFSGLYPWTSKNLSSSSKLKLNPKQKLRQQTHLAFLILKNGRFDRGEPGLSHC